MEWKEHRDSTNPFEQVVGINKLYTVYLATYDGPDSGIAEAARKTADYFVDFIPQNISETSHYIIFCWDDVNSILSAYVTSKNCEEDEKYVVDTLFSKVQNNVDEMVRADDEYQEYISKCTDEVKKGLKTSVRSQENGSYRGLEIGFIIQCFPDEIEAFKI